MKHFINIFITLILVALLVGIAYLTRTSTAEKNCWPFCFLPLGVFLAYWLDSLFKTYNKD